MPNDDQTPRDPDVAPTDESDADLDQDRAAILSRRRRFIVAAMSSVAGAALVAGCESSATNNQPHPCLSVVPADAGPMSPVDPSASSSVGAPIPTDTAPRPCLSVAPVTPEPSDAGVPDASPRPTVCLKVKAPSDGGSY